MKVQKTNYQPAFKPTFTSLDVKNTSKISKQLVDKITMLGKELDGAGNKIVIMLEDGCYLDNGYDVSTRKASLNAVIDDVPIEKTFKVANSWDLNKVEKQFIDYLEKLVKAINPKFRLQAESELVEHKLLIQQYKNGLDEIKLQLKELSSKYEGSKQLVENNEEILSLYTPKEVYKKLKAAELRENRQKMLDSINQLDGELNNLE